MSKPQSLDQLFQNYIDAESEFRCSLNKQFPTGARAIGRDGDKIIFGNVGNLSISTGDARICLEILGMRGEIACLDFRNVKVI